ncbi:D-serine ammonia-lyase [Cupriavidus pauculus]|uniref:Probable D-serine dehydratase n=1 Tax=Cupriavidus pauculus TaxID=82633 RepID=A0A5P2H433_9BURK|nr:D-serine ammonia-lyase [Cupriavidus pauculus]QET02434.1 D-serine ammonia-lyase [Cupriavidus pauculus]
MTTETISPEPMLLEDLRAARPLLWTNPARSDAAEVKTVVDGRAISLADSQAAQDRFLRFAPLLAQLFPELRETGGRIESGLHRVSAMQRALGIEPAQGALWVKADHGLPVAGSIKARGGIHEVLEFAESLALKNGLVTRQSDYTVLGQAPARELFARYEVAVGSTGNLGLSIGVMAAALGFRATVHMSADAKEWKKARLRARGVNVVEHEGDYAEAVAAGRRQAEQDPYCYFVDDERSLSLMLGYSAAALHLRDQFDAAGIVVDAAHPLFVYLPCGVGGAPAGIAFGLRQIYGPHVHAFFAEPTQSPCFFVEMLSPGKSVYDYGLDNRTEADGLAVPRASELAAEAMTPMLAGGYTVADDTLFLDLHRLRVSEGMHVEPSAAAGFSGPDMLLHSAAGRKWLRETGLGDALPNATHLVWTTGGLFVPPEAYAAFAERGAAIAVRANDDIPPRAPE